VRYVLQRIAFYLFTAWAAITLNFFIPRMIPGDPVTALLARFQGQMNSDAIESLYVLFGIDKDAGLWSQYIDYWEQLLHGDLGLSFSAFPTPVSEVIGEALPWTVALIGITTVISFILGTGLGVLVGWRRGSCIDGLLPATTFLSSVPYFWLGLLAIFLLAGPDSFFPASGGYEGGLVPAWDQYFIPSAVRHSLLPALTILISSVSGWILSMRNMMVTVSAEDYFIVGGTLLVEMVFSYPGLGFLLFRAVGAKDYPLMQGIFLIITIAVLVANLLADLVYLLLDPRTRKEG
jgi:peptide/nickel transport system permease protein